MNTIAKGIFNAFASTYEAIPPNNAITGALNIMAQAVDRTIPAHIQQSANKISFKALDEPVMRDCPECKGEGEFSDISLCCGAAREKIRTCVRFKRIVL